MRPFSTLFLLTSVDGKISSGWSDELDVDSDWSRIQGVREGIYQYYALEQETDLFSLNSGRTWAKIGFNTRLDEPDKTPVTFVVIDSKPHLSLDGVRYAAKKSHDNVSIVLFREKIEFLQLMERLKSEYGADYLTIQTGGTLNAELLRLGLVDRLHIVMAPLLVGGQETPSMVGGQSLMRLDELHRLKVLRLRSVRMLTNSYLDLEYDVLPDTQVV